MSQHQSSPKISIQTFYYHCVLYKFNPTLEAMKIPNNHTNSICLACSILRIIIIIILKLMLRIWYGIRRVNKHSEYILRPRLREIKDDRERQRDREWIDKVIRSIRNWINIFLKIISICKKKKSTKNGK